MGMDEMKVYDNGIFRDMTEEEIAEMQEATARAEAEEKKRPLTLSEVQEMFVRQRIGTLTVDDTTAYRMKDFYPVFMFNTSYAVGDKFVYNGELYKVLVSHTSEAAWLPGAGTESLYERIDEQHDGTRYDPIPYSGNMQLYVGKYYIENDIVYVCTRDTGNPVYHPLSELVGLYVSVA